MFEEGTNSIAVRIYYNSNPDYYEDISNRFDEVVIILDELESIRDVRLVQSNGKVMSVALKKQL